MKEQFINSKVIGIIYKNLVSKLNLELNSDQKTKLTRKIIYVMNHVFSNVDIKRVNSNNLKNILRQFINNSYQLVYSEINKDSLLKKEKFTQDTNSGRDQKLYGDRKPVISDRPGYADDRYASFNDSFKMNPREQTNLGFQGRFDPSSGNIGKKSDFSKNIDDRYSELQNEYKNGFNMNKKPTTPPQLKGDGGANLNRYTKENIKNKQNSNQSNNQNNNQNNNISQQNFLNSSDPRAKSSQNNNMPKDTFNFGTVTDLENNYDTIDGSNQEYQGNMDIRQWNTGINPEKFNIDESIPLEQKLKQYQSEREMIEKDDSKDNKKQVRFNQENSYNDVQSQQKNQQQMQQQMQQQQMQQQIQQQQMQQQMQEQQMQKQMQQQRNQQQIPQQQMPQQQRNQQQIPQQQIYQQQMQKQQVYRQNEDESQYRDHRQEPIDDKIDEYEHTIGLLLEKVRDLQQQQLTELNGGNVDADEKIRMLANKKDEILSEVNRLQSMTLELERQQLSIQDREHQIRKKELAIDQKIEKYSNLKNIDEKQIIIKGSAGKFTYSLREPCVNIVGIELLNYNIPCDTDNINNTNNKLYFSIVSENVQPNDNTDDEILSSDNENYVEEININSNKIQVMTIPPNNYDIYGLIEVMNKIGKKHNLQICMIKGRIVIKTEKSNKLKLYMDREYSNNILLNLGFSKIIGDKYKHISDRKYNLKSDKLIQLYIKNINSEPFAEFMIDSEKKHIFKKDININNLNRFELELKLNDKLLNPQQPFELEFNIIMNNNSNKKQENEVNTDDDLLSKVSNLMNI